MNMDELAILKASQVEIMDEVHRICCENNIVYYIIGGTALGAVRHGGYIPWDIDIDIAMPRADYERFAEISAQNPESRFAFRDSKNARNYAFTHARFCIKDTLLFDKYEHLNSKDENIGIYIDIFPLDKAPEDEALQLKQTQNLNKIKKLLYFKTARCYKRDFKNMVVKKIISTMIFWTDVKKIIADFDKECRRYENTDSTLLCSMSSHYKYSKQCMPASVYGKPQLVKFEGREYYAPEMLDDYLTRIYGDYMKLPPEEERQANLEVFKKVVYDR